MAEKIIHANGVDLCTGSFGDPADPAILLIMGAMASMLWWDEEFCRMLAGHGHYVIRYDHRDTGRSITYEPGLPPTYTVDDLVDDAVGVLDAYGIERAHLVGMSLGGILAQIIPVKYPGRALTITMIASTITGPEQPDLPGIDQKILDYHAGGTTVDWASEPETVAFMAHGWELLNGSAHPFDEKRARELATQEFRRAENLLSMMNHAQLTGGEEWYEKLGEIDIPSLVIHGTEDCVLPYPHGIALARKIPGSHLLTLQGSGHELHRDDWKTIIDAIVQHAGTALTA